MKKRLFSLILTAALLTGLLPAALAAVPAQEQASRTLAALDVMVGDENGNLMLTRSVTRAEFTKMVVAMSSYKDSVGDRTLVSPYPDVPYTNWAAPYIESAVQAGFVIGYLDGTFRPGNTITLAEGVTMALRLLGYTDSDFTGVFPSGQMALYRTLKLNEGITASSNTALLTRQDTMYLLFNLLTAKTKTGSVYLTTLGHSLTASGEVDLVALVNEAMDGPIVASSAWQSDIPFTLGNATFYRSGSLSSLSAIQSGDVLYWSKSMRTVWAYTTKVTGTYQAVSPSASAPSSVTVAGKSYAIETADAAFALSNLGQYRTGDTITLLLGRSGGVAAVQASGQTASSVVYGVVSALGSGSYSDANGNSYTASTLTLTATDGEQYTYLNSLNGLKTGDLVEVNSTAAGSVTVKRLTSASLSGKINTAGTKLGSHSLAAGIEILDVNDDGSALRVYPARLAGINFQSGMIRYYTLNSSGEINRLILNDVTGDLNEYGVVTSVTQVDSNMSVMSSYVYDIGGVSGYISSSSSSFNISKGPCKFILKGGSVSSISNLTSVKLSAISGNTGLSGNTSYTLADDVLVYEVDGGDYYLSSLDRISSGYSLTGWYDRAESSGGRIRVIMAIASAS